MSFRYTIETENPIVIDENKMFNCKDGKLRLKIVDANPWHTGTPTEEGWYVCKMKGADLYETEYFTGANWNEEIIEKWQQIEEASK